MNAGISLCCQSGNCREAKLQVSRIPSSSYALPPIPILSKPGGTAPIPALYWYGFYSLTSCLSHHIEYFRAVIKVFFSFLNNPPNPNMPTSASNSNFPILLIAIAAPPFPLASKTFLRWYLYTFFFHRPGTSFSESRGTLGKLDCDRACDRYKLCARDEIVFRNFCDFPTSAHWKTFKLMASSYVTSFAGMMMIPTFDPMLQEINYHYSRSDSFQNLHCRGCRRGAGSKTGSKDG